MRVGKLKGKEKKGAEDYIKVRGKRREREGKKRGGERRRKGIDLQGSERIRQ